MYRRWNRDTTRRSWKGEAGGASVRDLPDDAEPARKGALDAQEEANESGDVRRNSAELASLPPETTRRAIEHVPDPERVLAETLLPPLEPRAWTVVWRAEGSFVRTGLAGCLGLPQSHIRVVSPDVGGVVRQKIMNYPAEKLEELVLSVAKEHLRTIEFFGALFGFIIGLGQAIQFYIYSR